MKVRCIKNVEGIDNEFAFIEGEIYKAILIDNNLKITGESNYMWSLFKDEVFNEHFEYIKAKKDPIVKQVTDKFKARSKVGIAKYGTTLEENNTDDFLTHLEEEMMDSLLYIQKLKSQKDYSLQAKHNELIQQFDKLKKEQLEYFSEVELINHLGKKGYSITIKREL